jgi:hypothetical protein
LVAHTEANQPLKITNRVNWIAGPRLCCGSHARQNNICPGLGIRSNRSFPRATLVSSPHEPKVVNIRTSGCDHGDSVSSHAQPKKGARGFCHLPPRLPLYFYPHLSPPSLKPPFLPSSSLFPRTRKVSRRCGRRRRLGYSHHFINQDTPPSTSSP